MNPAFHEYFHTYEGLKEELSTYKTQQNEFKFQISKLLDENKRLYTELKENIKMREQLSSENGFSSMEEKYRETLAAKNAAIEMWQEALHQLEKQEEQLVGKRSILECQQSQSEKVIEQVKEEYVKGLNILSTEVTTYRNELSNASQELHIKTAELGKCKNDIETLSNEVNAYKKNISVISLEKAEMEEKVTSLSTLLSETENFLSATKEEMTSVKTENFELSSLVTDFKEQNKKLRTEIIIFEKDAKESLLTAQEAILKKKEMAYREDQYLKDIEHLKLSVNIEAEKISFKYKSELKEIQKQSTQKVQTLMEEIQTLHQENSDKQSLFEKAVREKQALESKLELLYSEFSNGNPISSGAIDDLCKRLTMAERSRDEYEFRVRSFEIDLQEMKSAKEQEIQCIQEEKSTLKERLRKVLEDFNKSSTDRLQLSDEVSRLKKACYSLEKESRQTIDRQTNEISSLRDEARQKQQSLTEQLVSSEEHYKKVCNELQKLLDAEFKISNKWKEEVDDLITKSEAKIKELCQTIVHLQNQNKELICAFGQSNSYVPNLSAHAVNRFPGLNYNIETPSD